MRLFLILLTVVVIQACAMKKVAVNNADSFIEHAVEKRVPLNADQRLQLSKDIDQFLMKKKTLAQDMLPVIDQINVEDPEKFDAIFERLSQSYEQLATDFSAITARYIARLDVKQQQRMFENLSAENRDARKKTPEARVADMQKKISKLLGPLTKNQEKFFQDHQSHMAQKGLARIERKENLHAEMKEILAQDNSAPIKEQQIRDAFARYQAKSVESGKENVPLLKKFAPTLTLKQKETFREKVREVKEIIGHYMEAEY